jgi:hypothetical protein
MLPESVLCSVTVYGRKILHAKTIKNAVQITAGQGLVKVIQIAMGLPVIWSQNFAQL